MYTTKGEFWPENLSSYGEKSTAYEHKYGNKRRRKSLIIFSIFFFVGLRLFIYLLSYSSFRFLLIFILYRFLLFSSTSFASFLSLFFIFFSFTPSPFFSVLSYCPLLLYLLYDFHYNSNEIR